MRITLFFAMVLIVSFQSCNGQIKKNEVYNEMFKWTITIPEKFENVKPEEWKKLQNKGVDAIEKTYDGKVENNAKTIFVFKNDQFNYFESNYQPFDTATDGNYLESFKAVNEMIYGTFKAQMPDATSDTATSQETIAGLTFQTFKMTVYFPNKMVMDFWMYSRLFDKKEFTVNIMTVDKTKRDLLLNAWKNSKFN